MKLCVEAKSWSGWSPNHIPEVKIIEYDLKKNAQKVIKGEDFFDKFKFVIKEIGDDYIIIETKKPMSESINNRTKLMTRLKEFKIEKGKILILATPTMDYGWKYTFELKDK